MLESCRLVVSVHVSISGNGDDVDAPEKRPQRIADRAHSRGPPALHWRALELAKKVAEDGVAVDAVRFAHQVAACALLPAPVGTKARRSYPFARQSAGIDQPRNVDHVPDDPGMRASTVDAQVAP